MQSSSQAVCLNLQQPEDKGEDEDSRLRGASGVQIQEVNDYVLWSLCNFACFFWNYLCCCLGFAALFFSIKSRDRKVVGDVEGASSYGKTALCLNITALVVGILIFLGAIITMIVVFTRRW